MCRNQEILPVSVSLFLRYLLFSNLLRLWDTLHVVSQKMMSRGHEHLADQGVGGKRHGRLLKRGGASSMI
ncbi:MAG: hypothetical protein J6386_02105 [Candidatus Synoicihabitans palmerolidicus]|nr:hypothetical protein [Candidatus Synoicihabitans palmerolidicus]